MSNDLSNLVTPKQINEYERSDAARSAIAHLEQLSGAHSLQVNQSLYTNVRDFILLEITIANAHRSGVLANMTMESRKSAVTNVHTSHKEMKSDLADLMVHKETTAQRFYRLKEKEEACLQAASCLLQIMRSSEPKQGIKRKEPTSKSPDDIILTAADRDTADGVLKECLLWNEEDVTALKDVFSKEIETKSLTMAVVKDKIQGHPTLSSGTETGV